MLLTLGHSPSQRGLCVNTCAPSPRPSPSPREREPFRCPFPRRGRDFLWDVQPLLSKLAGIRSGDQVIYWEIGRDQGGAEIRLPGSAVPISQDPAPPARR